MTTYSYVIDFGKYAGKPRSAWLLSENNDGTVNLDVLAEPGEFTDRRTSFQRTNVVVNATGEPNTASLAPEEPKVTKTEPPKPRAGRTISSESAAPTGAGSGVSGHVSKNSQEPAKETKPGAPGAAPSGPPSPTIHAPKVTEET